ncbi:ARID DNA-binding domain-containing protein [Tanacetum coccineum]
MASINSFYENRWSRPNSSAYGHSNMWYQSKSLRRPLRKRLHYDFIQRQLKREKEARLGNCIRQITHDCKDMLRKKLEEIELCNSTISQNRSRKQKCYKCRQRGHIIKNCPMIHFSTKCMIKGTDQGHWDDIWYISNDTNMYLCSKLNIFCNIKENFAVNKLDDQMKFLFAYGIGEVVVKNGDQGYLIPGVHYAPEVTLNILSIELLERQGIEIIYEDNTCRLIYMFSNPKDHKLNEDKLRTMQNEYLEKYFDSLEKGDTSNTKMKSVGMISMEDDLIEIKGTIYSTRVNTFNEYVAFLNLSLPGPIPPKINGVTIYLMDLYKLVESLGGYLSVYFAKNFGKIWEILGLSIQDREEVRRCYINFLDVFTSYYKTARVPKQEHNLVLAPNIEATNRKGKEKIEHFEIILEDTRKESDSHHFQPKQPNIKRSLSMNKDMQGIIKKQNLQTRKTPTAAQVMASPSLLERNHTRKED